jgi:hypothetical protein
VKGHEPESDDDSPVTILRHLEEERGRMFTEDEFQKMRAAVLHELSHGARLRPFTLFTFAVIALGLLAMLVVGLTLPSGKSRMHRRLSPPLGSPRSLRPSSLAGDEDVGLDALVFPGRDESGVAQLIQFHQPRIESAQGVLPDATERREK